MGLLAKSQYHREIVNSLAKTGKRSDSLEMILQSERNFSKMIFK